MDTRPRLHVRCLREYPGQDSYSLPREGLKKKFKHQAHLFTHNSSEGTFCLTATPGPGAPWSLDLLGLIIFLPNLGPSSPDRRGLTRQRGWLALLLLYLHPRTPITYLPHPLILGKKTHQNNYFMSPNMQIIFFNERCLTSPIQLICKCRRGFICDILSG